MPVITELLARLGIDPREFDKGLKGAEKTLKKTASNLDKIGKDLSLNVSVPIAAIGGLAIKSFTDFDAAMTKSTAIMGNVTDKLGEMEGAALDVARTTTFSASQAAEAFFFLASAGLNAEQSIAALPKVAAFAQAGMFDLALATDLLTDAQSALGLTVKDVDQNLINLTRVSDVLVEANNAANASVEQFSKSLTNQAAAAARNVGIEIEEVVAVLAAFADQGIKGEEAGTKFAIVVRDLTTRAIENAEAFEKFGIAVFDSNRNLRPLADIIGALEGRLGNASVELQKMTLLQLGFSDRSVGALQSLIGLSEKIREYEKRFKSAGGTTAEVARKQLGSASAQFQLLRNRAVEVLITLGAQLVPVIREDLIPAVDGVIKIVAGWIKSFSELGSGTKRMIIGAIGLIAALGPLAIGFATVIKVLLALKAVLLSPAIGLILAGGALITGIIAIGRHLLISADAAEAYAGKMVGASEAMQRAATAGRTLEEQLKLENIQLATKNIIAMEGQLFDLEKQALQLRSAGLAKEFIAVQSVIENVTNAIRDARLELKLLQDPGQFDVGGTEFIGPVLPEDQFTSGFKKLMDDFSTLGERAKTVFGGIKAVGIKAFGAVSETIDAVVITSTERFAQFFTDIAEKQVAFSEQANQAWSTWLAQATSVTANIKLATLDFFQSFASGLGDAVAQIVVFRAKAEDVFNTLLKNILAQVIATLVRIVVEFIIASATKALIATVVHTVQVAQAIQLVYLATLASISAIPIIGPLIAPGIASAAAAAAGPLSAAAGKGGAGSAIASLDTGGLVMADGAAMLHSGERVLKPDEVKVLPDLQLGSTTIIVELDGKEIARNTVRRMPRELRMRGVGR